MTEPKPHDQYQSDDAVTITVPRDVARFVDDVLKARAESRSRLIERTCCVDLPTLKIGRILSFERSS